MPGLDWLPLVSQLKSTVQLIAGDVDGAAETQANFLRECPGVSQVTSVVQLATGDADGALDTQKRCLGTISNVADATPVVGHVKGLVHYAVGDEKGGDQAMNAATRSTVVIGSGAAAGLASGGLAAIPAGIAAGATYDTAATVITDKPQGIYAAVKNAVDNPNAGNIFDAAFVPVGDGLAGYAGGKMANNIANAVKINSLESVRAAKMARLDAALEGKISMTSGESLALGNEINALTSQINVVKYGTPKFWYDPKSEQVLIKPNNTAVPIAGYIDEEDPKKRAEIVKEIYNLQENAYSHDSTYIEYGGNCTTTADKQKVLTTRKQQKAKGNLKNVYPNISVVKENDMTKAKKDFEQNKNNQKAKEAFNVNNWLHVPMPQQFNFTGAIMTNYPHQGLFHSVGRHGSQWAAVIPNFRQIFQQLPNDIQNRLRAIENEPNAKTQQALLTDLHTIISTHYPDTMIRIHDLQMEIYRFLRNRVNYPNYLGEGVNTNGHVQYYFDVGNNQVMVICPSGQLFSPDPNFGDSRPIRTITTIFFISYSKLKNLKISKMF